MPAEERREITPTTNISRIKQSREKEKKEKNNPTAVSVPWEKQVAMFVNYSQGLFEWTQASSLFSLDRDESSFRSRARTTRDGRGEMQSVDVPLAGEASRQTDELCLDDGMHVAN